MPSFTRASAGEMKPRGASGSQREPMKGLSPNSSAARLARGSSCARVGAGTGSSRGRTASTSAGEVKESNLNERALAISAPVQTPGTESKERTRKDSSRRRTTAARERSHAETESVAGCDARNADSQDSRRISRGRVPGPPGGPSGPSARARARRRASNSARSSAAPMEAAERGSQNAASSPTTSGSAPVFEAKRGRPAASPPAPAGRSLRAGLPSPPRLHA